MANPRQRNKAKSHKSTKPSANAIKRLHTKMKKTPVLKGPEVLQKGWDKKKTVFQNYAALGLLPSIPIPQVASSSRSQRVKLPQIPTADQEMDVEEAPKFGFGRIIRDEEGNVIDIIIDEDDQPAAPRSEVEQSKNVPFEEQESERAPVQAKTEVVRQLEALSAGGAPVNRHTSVSERTWLQSLVDKYGDDVDSMVRDKKLNVWQKTPGEIKRMIKKAGGVQKLRQ